MRILAIFLLCILCSCATHNWKDKRVLASDERLALNVIVNKHSKYLKPKIIHAAKKVIDIGQKGQDRELEIEVNYHRQINTLSVIGAFCTALIIPGVSTGYHNVTLKLKDKNGNIIKRVEQKGEVKKYIGMFAPLFGNYMGDWADVDMYQIIISHSLPKLK